MQFSTAVVLPVSISTASAALFGRDNMGLAPPRAVVSNSSVVEAESISTILVWGGSTSVGCAAIQLARAVRLQVVTTASMHNFGLCKAVGAHQVFDRESDSVVDEIVAALQGKDLVGTLNAVGVQDAVQACIDVVVRTKGRKFVATTLPVEEHVDRKGVEVNFCKCGTSSLAKRLISCRLYPY
jgi:NADPH:quinone reductase-like Zn-dependent oxidoreductase